MKKLKNKGGFTLIEMMAALLILVLLVVAMGYVMDSASQVYEASTFESQSGSLSGILNTALGDILRYSYTVTKNDGTMKDSAGNHVAEEDVGFFFTSLDYGIRDGYFYAPWHPDGTYQGVLQIKNLHDSNVVELVNAGSYPNMAVSNFHITYVAPGAIVGGTPVRGGYFDIKYTIFDRYHASRSRDVSCIVRRMNN